MFTIKLYQDSDNYTVLCTPNYEIEKKCDSSVSITVYKDFTAQSGVTYQIAQVSPTQHWKYAFIENVSGKTIDHIKCGSL